MSDIDALRADARQAAGEPKLPDEVVVPYPRYDAMMKVAAAAVICIEVRNSYKTSWDRYDALKHEAWSQLEEALAALRAAGKGGGVMSDLPQGFALVPIEATHEMMRAGVDAAGEAPPPSWHGAGRPGNVQIRAAWEAMIGAAPPPPAGIGEAS